MRSLVCLFALCVIWTSCRFDYGNVNIEENNFPDITMEDLEYVRVREGRLTARLKAEIGERYESKHIMNLSNYQFEQYDSETSETDAVGSGGSAAIELTNNNIRMSEGVSIQVDSEDFALEAVSLEWQDKNRVLQGAPNTPVQISRKDGSEINGSDFHADVRDRSWVFGANVHGTYVQKDDEAAPSEPGDITVKVNGASVPVDSVISAGGALPAAPGGAAPAPGGALPAAPAAVPTDGGTAPAAESPDPGDSASNNQKGNPAQAVP
jgi:LPS export ABC transporter protein LptC